MAAEIFDLEFEGYWTEKTKGTIPSLGGIYCVYEGSYGPEKEGVAIRRLIYIGESNDVNQSVSYYKNWDRWRRHVGRGNDLCFSIAPLESTFRRRVKAALVFQHKPPLNQEFKESFPFDGTTISGRGKTALLNTHFTLDGLAMK
jgi:hypothetical protein